MGWSIGFDSNWQRDIGYGVPAQCDHPECNERIDRGLAYVCGGEPYGGDDGCGLYFCASHLRWRRNLCEQCVAGKAAFAAKPDVAEWLQHKLTDPSWADWRTEHAREVHEMRMTLGISQGVKP
ncbi:hypothetical protein [Chitinasiproducens palmae]|uniref:Uncharacterized protein n=1 Tax=Chitinasiproducens palmae TaxID=1770053 RepID=A0A1H2PPR6_9BURK|nr:hypothetical protein [Chitinasiproducens palmae]SDV47941.1 hypothetical protein SAMN05216551_10418 [Chitinasiproducens palmae]